MTRTIVMIITAATVALALAFAAVNAGPALACTKARVGGQTKCLQRGQFCQAAHKAQYFKYGFRCVSGRLR